MRRIVVAGPAGGAYLGLGLGAAILVAFVLALVGNGTAGHPDPALAEQGKVTYVRYCVSCHGPGGQADGPLARDLAVAVPDLTTMAARSGGAFPYARVERIITHGEQLRGHGSADMPAWGDAFKKTQGIAAPTVESAIRNLSHYLWSLQAKPAKSS